MASLTQKIPNYLSGISDQPDELKAPGQVVDLKNGLPDLVKGLTKRPGSELIKDVTADVLPLGNSQWFPVYKDDDEHYIGQISAGGAIKVLRCSDGASIPIDYSGVTGSTSVTYLDNSGVSDASSSDYQALTINETTFICNRQKTVEMKTDAKDKAPAQLNEAYIELDQVAYGKQYALDIYSPDSNTEYSYTRATGITTDDLVLVIDRGEYLNNGSCKGMSRDIVMPEGGPKYANVTYQTNTGTAIHDTSPPNASATGKKNLMYEMDVRCQAQVVNLDSATTVDRYEDSYHPYGKLLFGGEGWTSDGDTVQRIQVTDRGGKYVFADGGFKSSLAAWDAASTGDKVPVQIGERWTASTSYSSGDRVFTTVSHTVATSAVTTGTDTITISNHGFETRDAVIYNNGGGAVITGLTHNHEYFVIKVDANNIKLAENPASATGGSAVSISGTGNNSQKINGDGNNVYSAGSSATSGSTAPSGTTTSSDGTITWTYVGTKARAYATKINFAIRELIIEAAGTPKDSNTTLYDKPPSVTIGRRYQALTGYVTHDQIANGGNIYEATGTISAGAGLPTHTVGETGDWEYQGRNGQATAILGDYHTYISSKGIKTNINIISHETIKGRGDIAMVRPEPTSPSSEHRVSSTSILNGIKTKLDSISGTGITANIVGKGIHLYRATPFGVSSIEKQLLSVITSETKTIADLPRTCRHGFITKIVNTDTDNDDYYVKFLVEGVDNNITKDATYARSSTTVTVTSTAHGLVTGDKIIIDITSGGATDNLYSITRTGDDTFTFTDSVSGTIASGSLCTYTPVRYGEGVWEECPAPGIEISFNPDTMPVKLVRELPSPSYTNGRFLVQYPGWDDRDVGDDTTNPKPSFVGKEIQKMVFFRNRIVMLSAENCILSRVNEFTHFWAKTALTVSPVDPIDLQSSSTFPTILYDAVETNNGLVVFSANQQFLLNSGADAILKADTAKIDYLSAYAFNKNSNAFSLGSTVGFINSTAKNARFFEMNNIQTRTQPQVLEQSLVISKLFPEDIVFPAESIENNLVLFSQSSLNSSEIWGYKYHNQGDRRVQSAWFRWTLPNKIVYHTIMDDIYYFILYHATDEKYTLEKIDLKLDDTTTVVGSAPNEYRIYLDTRSKISSSAMTYDSTRDVTSFSEPTGYYSSGTMTAFVTDPGDMYGRSGSCTESGCGTYELEGNWKSYVDSDGDTVTTDLILGYDYEFEVELPKIYVQATEGGQVASDTRGSLIIHRLNFDFGYVGLIDVTLKRKGKDDYSTTYESLEWDDYLAESLTVANFYTHTVPAYERNTNLNIHLKSTSPSPANLHSMSWEGDYSNRFYSSV